jgi:uncharacterized membrane protein
MKCHSILLNFLLSISLFCLSFYVAWNISATTNFLYPTWYEALSLDEAISKYAPNNKLKHGFENTSKQQHVELFSGIVDAIQNNGNGLRELSYTDLKKQVTDTLLTDAEVVHLEDVANLVNKFKFLAVFGFLVALIVFVLMQVKNISIAKFSRHLLGGLGTIAVLVVLVLAVGSKKVFYVGHELIFPNNHQWFFYYEESLMSTMMEAPALFGPIAGQLLLLTVLFWLAGLYVLQKAQLTFKKA